MSDDMTEAQAIQGRNFLAMVCQVTDAHRMAKNKYLHRFAPDYSVFDFIEPDELRLSKILAWFLDPHQTHGQGSLFLRLFLEALGVRIEAEGCDRGEVRTEVSIREGRLDILVSMAGLQVAIENKPWAGDQDTQLTRYFSHFDAPSAPNYQVVYLTSKGTAPPEHSIREQERDRRIAGGQLQLWSYDKEVLVWLTKCRAECRADRVSIFIDEFSRYIQAVFEGVRDRTMSDHLLDEIAGSAEKASAAMQVILLADPLRKRLLSDFRQQLLAKLPGRDIELSDDPWAKYSGLTISYSEECPYQFSMEFQNTQFNGLVIGIARKSENSPVRANEFESLVRDFGTASQNVWWLWWRWASPTDSLLPVPRDW
jgi:hypothetical protein